MPPTIFVSYRRRDARAMTERICDVLKREFGDDCLFKDVDSLRAGESFPEQLEVALSESKVMLAAVGPAWSNMAGEDGKRRIDQPEDYVRLEIESAIRNGLTIMPVTLGGAAMPSATELPTSISKLSLNHALPIRDDPDFKDDVLRLVERLCELGFQRPHESESADGTLIQQIPPPPPDFVDRVQELRDVLNTVQDGQKRIVSIRGNGGMGKTAFARQAASKLTEKFPLQLSFDMRGSKSDPADPEEAIASWLNLLSPEQNVPDSGTGLQGKYLSILGGKRALIHLDDVAGRSAAEHLIPPEPSVLVISSRRQFMLPGQHAVNLDRLPEDAAVQLVLDICDCDEASAKSLAKICGGLPFALRLAGGALAQGPYESAEDFIEYLESDRLRSLEDGESSAEEIITACVGILSDDQRARLGMLAVFTGPFGKDGAAAVWDETAREAMPHLTKLLEYCLLQWTPSTKRFSIHDLLREFLGGDLDAESVTNARMRHAGFLAGTLQQCEQGFLDGDSTMSDTLVRLDPLWPDLRLAFQFVYDKLEDSEDAATLCSAIAKSAFLFWETRENVSTQLLWAQWGLAAAEKVSLDADIHVHLRRIAWFNLFADPEKAKELLNRALDICTRLGLSAERGKTISYLALVADRQNDLESAQRLIDESLVIARDTGDRRAESIALGRKAQIEGRCGNADARMQLLEEAVVLDEGDERGQALDLLNLASAYAENGDQEGTLGCLVRVAGLYGALNQHHDEWTHSIKAIQLGRKLKSEDTVDQLREHMIRLLRQDDSAHAVRPNAASVGMEALRASDKGLALECFKAALQWAQDTNNRRAEGDALGNLGCAATELGDYDSAIQWHEQALAVDRDLEDAAGEAIGSWDLGETYERMGRFDDAVRFMQLRVDFEHAKGNLIADELQEKVDVLRQKAVQE